MRHRDLGPGGLVKQSLHVVHKLARTYVLRIWISLSSRAVDGYEKRNWICKMFTRTNNFLVLLVDSLSVFEHGQKQKQNETELAYISPNHYSRTLRELNRLQKMGLLTLLEASCGVCVCV